MPTPTVQVSFALPQTIHADLAAGCRTRHLRLGPLLQGLILRQLQRWAAEEHRICSQR